MRQTNCNITIIKQIDTKGFKTAITSVNNDIFLIKKKIYSIKQIIQYS